MIICAVRAKSIIKGFLIFVAVVACIAAAISAIFQFETKSALLNVKKELPIYYVDTKDKTAAITFDCAWGSDDIPDILAALGKENVKATFFIVGQWAEKYPDVVKMIANEGHDIANHGYSHLRMGALDEARITSEIAMCRQKLEQISGKKVDLFRPPYGDYSNNVVNIARKLNHYPIQWDVDSLDWRPGISKSEILKRISQKVKSGSIILFHNDTPYTAELLPTVISTIKKGGYEIRPVSRLIIKEPYIIEFDGKQKKRE